MQNLASMQIPKRFYRFRSHGAALPRQEKAYSMRPCESLTINMPKLFWSDGDPMKNKYYPLAIQRVYESER